MTQYNPFDEPDNPFDQRNELSNNIKSEKESLNTIFNFSKKTYAIVFGTLTLVIFATTVNKLIQKDDLVVIEEPITSDVVIQTTIPITTSTIPATTTTLPNITTTTVYVPEITTVTESTQPTENSVYVNQDLIVKKTVQVVAEQCGLGPDDRESWTSVGSGVIISSDGYVISNSHVIEDCYGEIYIATTSDVDTPTEISYLAEVINQNIQLDLVLLKIKKPLSTSSASSLTNFNYFELFDTNELKLGETVQIWGYPTSRGDGITYALKINLTKGTISGFESDFNLKRGWIVTDADISYGNSGGAALDEFGRLVGIPTFGVTEGAAWLGYLRSVDVIKAWLESINFSKVNNTSSDFPKLEIRDESINIPSYNREEWNTWIDVDDDCQNTRHENLQLESFLQVTFTTVNECFVEYGKWFDPYNGEYIYSAKELDIDHFLPLYNVHISGGWEWSVDKKTAFANNLIDPDLLIAVKSETNREKSAKTPDQWRPANESYWCEYAFDWIRIKFEWNLTATQAEWDALMEMVNTCPPEFQYNDAENQEHLFNSEKLEKYKTIGG